MNKRKKLPKRWRWAELGDADVAEIIMGQSPPGSSYNTNGDGLPFYQGKAEFGEMSPSPRVWCSDPKKIAQAEDILLSVRAPVGPTNIAIEECCIGRGLAAIRGRSDALTEYIFFYMRHIEPWLSGQGEGSTFKAIGKTKIEDIEIPLPPLAVQERIVEVLQQADAIRRKRAEARSLADKILPALFLDMFGDPATNPKGWPVTTLEDVLTLMRNGTTAAQNTEGIGHPVSRIETISYETIDARRVRWVDLDDKQIEKWRMKPGDILFSHINSIEHIAKTALYLGEPSILIHGMNLLLLRPNQEKCLPEFLHAFLKTPTTRDAFRKKAKQAVNQASLNQKDLKSQQIPLPPLDEQKRFVYAAEEIQAQMEKQTISVNEAEEIFFVLLSRAFTGELTEEWETENADWIAERQAFYERLPRLALLTLLQERRERAGRNTETLITALMKYLFLIQMEGSLHRRLYRFVPYHYGPCAMELYGDLEALANDGLIIIENDAEEDKTRIRLVDPDRTAALLEEEAKKDDARFAAMDQSDDEAEAVTDPVMPRLLRRRAEILETLRTDSTAILDAYGDLDHNALLKTVYEKYPAYAKKSRLRRGRRPSTGRKGIKT